MSDYFKVLLLAELAAGYTVLFLWISRESILRQLWHRAYDSLETAAARRVRDNRRSLQMLRAKRGFWQRMELRLLYSGISRRFPFLTPELWILGNLAAGMAVYFLALLLGAAWQYGAADLCDGESMHEPKLQRDRRESHEISGFSGKLQHYLRRDHGSAGTGQPLCGRAAAGSAGCLLL